jgi:hypothetical protein
MACVWSGSASGARRFVRRSSWLSPFPRPEPPMLQPHPCSPASQVLRTHLTSYQRSCQHYRRKRSLTVPPNGEHATLVRRKPIGAPGSRVWSFHACTGSQTPPRPPEARRRRRRRCCLPTPGPGRHAKLVISELHGWPACTPCPCHTHDVTVISVGFRAERLARPFSYDSFIRYSRPVYPGAFPDTFVLPLFCLTPGLLSLWK